MPAWLLWLLPLPLATLGAIAWTSWSARARRPAQAFDSVEDFQRFRDALTTEAPPGSRHRADQPGWRSRSTTRRH